MKYNIGLTYMLSIVSEQHSNAAKVKVRLVAEDDELWTLDVLSGWMKGRTVSVPMKGEGFVRRLDEEKV